MSERYKTLYRIPENLYSNGSPLIIAAGALLKDNQSGKVLAHIEFKSTNDRRIKAVKIRVFAFDVTETSVGDAVEHQYLDLNVSRNDEFGSEEDVPLLFDATHSFSVQISSVIFSDGSIWEAPKNAEWKQLREQEEPSQKPIGIKAKTIIVCICAIVCFVLIISLVCSGSSNSNDTSNKCLGCGKTILWSDYYCYECQYKMGLTN